MIRIGRFRIAGMGLLLAIGLLLPAPGAAGAWSFTRPKDEGATAATLRALRDLDADADPRVWVFFTDKGIFDAAAYEQAVRSFAATLDAHASDRRAKTLGEARADFHDLPVRESYVRSLEERGATIVRTSRWLNAVSVRSPLTALEEIALLPMVASLARVGGGGSAPLTPGEMPERVEVPRDVFDYGPSFDQLAEIGVTDLHVAGFSGLGVRVAMLDTGFDRTHPAFGRILAEGRLLAQWDFINDDGETMNEPGDPATQDVHGTAVWSILAGFDEGDLIGPAWEASFLLAKTEDVSGETPIEEDNWVAAMEWADALGADILSSSLSYIDWYTYADMDGDTAITSIGADIAASRGILVCNSAGNWGTQDWYYIGAPADADSMMAVGGTMPNGDVWDDSSHGPTYDGRIKPEVCARGEGVYCAWPKDLGGPYIFVGGTSAACPLVAGSAALVLEAHPSWSAMAVREALMMTADQADAPDNDRGWGRIDARAAAGDLAGAPELEARTLPLRLWPNPAPEGGVFLAFEAAAAEIYRVDGALVRRIEGHAGSGPVLRRWDGRDGHGRLVADGLYFVRLIGSGAGGTAKLTLRR